MNKLQRLKNGETFITSEKGNSMTPLIKSGQQHIVAPIELSKCKVGDIVVCKVRARMYTHLVKAIDKNKGVLIANNKGRINGWTKQVYGIVIEVL